MAGLNVLWPEPHFAMLETLAGRGINAGRIAAELNEEFLTSYTRNAVIGKIRRSGVIWNTTYRFRGLTSEKRVTKMQKPWKVPAIKPPRPVTEAACAGIVPKAIRCVDLEPGHCRWPYGDAIITFCGHERLPGQPYCIDHQHLSRGYGTRSEREANRV